MFSCIFSQDIISNVQNIISGTWAVNDNKTEKITFSKNGEWSYIYGSDTINGTYIIEVEQQSTPYFIWNAKKDTHKILWKTKDKSGETIWIGYSDYGCDKIILKNIYNHDNEISVLTKE